MINLATLMSKITGKNAPGQTPGGDASRVAGGEAGVATGGGFAALVKLASQTDAADDQGGLRLVSDTDETVPAMAGETAPELGKWLDSMPGAVKPGATQPSVGILAEVRQKVAKMPTSTDAIAPAVDGAATKASLDPVAIDMSENGPATDAVTDKKDQPEPSVGVKPGEAIPGHVDSAVMSMQIAQAATSNVAAPRPVEQTRAVPADDPLTSPNPQAALAPATGGAPAMSRAVATGRATAEVGQSFSASVASLPAQAVAASSDKPKAETKTPRAVTPHAIFTATPDTVGVGDGKTANADSTQKTPADSSRTNTSDAASTATVTSPFRAIVDSLPPVIQSTLATHTVSAVAGPSTGQMLGDQVIDMGVSGQWIDRMAREITALSEGNGHSRFTLNPPHLGRLEVNLWQGQDGASLRLTAETDEAARRLSEGRPALQADARIAALNLGTITIEKSAPSHESGRDQGQRQNGDQASQMQQQSGGQGQGPGHNQTRAGNGQQGEWTNRFIRDEPIQNSDAVAAPTPAQRAARGNVRFA